MAILLNLCIHKQNTRGIVLQNISTGLGLFWDDSQQKNITSETLSHPPTSILNSDFGNLFYFA